MRHLLKRRGLLRDPPPTFFVVDPQRQCMVSLAGWHLFPPVTGVDELDIAPDPRFHLRRFFTAG